MSYTGLGVTELTPAQKALSPGWPDPSAPPGVQECQAQEVICRSKVRPNTSDLDVCEQTYSTCFQSDPGFIAQKSKVAQQGAIRVAALVGGVGVVGYVGTRAMGSKHPIVWGTVLAAGTFAMVVAAVARIGG
jgi:hypothetical protein